MKRSLFALAALTAFAGATFAQSSVTIGGKLDLAVGKKIGSADKGIFDTPGSRLNFGGREDLGGGMFAVFGIEHRFNPDDGTDASAGKANFWNGYSWVGLSGGFGTVRIGRDYTSAFITVQNQIDPFGGDQIPSLRQSSLQIAPAKVRFANGVKYFNSFGGLGVSFDMSEAGTDTSGAVPAPAAAGSTPAQIKAANGAILSVKNRPWSGSVTYAAGPVWLGFSHENPGGDKDKLSTLGARFAIGSLTLRAGTSFGTNVFDEKVKGYILAANYRMGAGDLRVGYAMNKTDDNTATETKAKRIGIGYHYDLSKRTKVYADVARDTSKATTLLKDNPTGYDFGIQHNF